MSSTVKFVLDRGTAHKLQPIYSRRTHRLETRLQADSLDAHSSLGAHARIPHTNSAHASSAHTHTIIYSNAWLPARRGRTGNKCN
jgi:hypothetical protein